MAIMLRQINAEIANLAYELITTTKILVRGDIVKQILYVSNDEVVRHQDEVVPFTVTLELLGLNPGTAVQVTAEIEHISPRLIDHGTSVEQQIIVQITVTPSIGGVALSKQFLVRSVTKIEEPAETISLEIHPKETVPLNLEPLLQDERAIVENTPFSDLTKQVEVRFREMEDQLRLEIEHALRSQLRIEMELELKARLAEEQRRNEADAQEAERKKQEELNTYYKELTRKSTMQRLYGFKTKG